MLKTFVQLQHMMAGVVRRDDRGATAVEYGMIVALIAAVIAVTVALAGTTIRTTFNNLIADL